MTEQKWDDESLAWFADFEAKLDVRMAEVERGAAAVVDKLDKVAAGLDGVDAEKRAATVRVAAEMIPADVAMLRHALAAYAVRDRKHASALAAAAGEVGELSRIRMAAAALRRQRRATSWWQYTLRRQIEADMVHLVMRAGETTR